CARAVSATARVNTTAAAEVRKRFMVSSAGLQFRRPFAGAATCRPAHPLILSPPQSVTAPSGLVRKTCPTLTPTHGEGIPKNALNPLPRAAAPAGTAPGASAAVTGPPCKAPFPDLSGR